MLQNKKIFITGGSGFIGSLLAEKLSHQNTICIYDTFSRNAIKNRNAIQHNNVTIIEGDVTNE